MPQLTDDGPDGVKSPLAAVSRPGTLLGESRRRSLVMEETAALRQTGADEREPRVRLLIADDDRAARSLLASSVCDVVCEIVVF